MASLSIGGYTISIPSISNPIDIVVNVFKEGYDALEDNVKDAWDSTIDEINRTGRRVLRETFRILGITDETIHIVEVSSQQLIPDPQRGSLEMAVLSSILNETEMLDEIKINALTGTYASHRRYFLNGALEYLYGYPTVSRANNDAPYTAMLTYLQAQVTAGFMPGTGTVSLITVEHGIVSRLKYVQEWITHFSDYNYTSQTMHLRAQGPEPQPDPSIVYTFTGVSLVSSGTFQDYYAPVFSPPLVANNQIPTSIPVPKAEYGKDLVTVVYLTSGEPGEYYICCLLYTSPSPRD